MQRISLKYVLANQDIKNIPDKTLSSNFDTLNYVRYISLSNFTINKNFDCNKIKEVIIEVNGIFENPIKFDRRYFHLTEKENFYNIVFYNPETLCFKIRCLDYKTILRQIRNVKVTLVNENENYFLLNGISEKVIELEVFLL